MRFIRALAAAAVLVAAPIHAIASEPEAAPQSSKPEVESQAATAPDASASAQAVKKPQEQTATQSVEAAVTKPDHAEQQSSSIEGDQSRAAS